MAYRRLASCKAPMASSWLGFPSAQIDEDNTLVPEAIQGGTYGFNSANVPAEGFQF